MPPHARLEHAGTVTDRLDRPLRDLRISVTDRCNFRCTYCMPKEIFDADYRYLPRRDMLSFEEIVRVARIFVSLGVEKIRLTGGEPLLRRDVERLVAMLSELTTASGKMIDLTLTTNGSLLEKKVQALRQAGLRRLTVSLDALDDAIFRRMNDVDFGVEDVLRGIDAAHRAGMAPIKINMVVKRGTNDGEVLRMARHFRGTPFILRFIEYMDVGTSNGWQMREVVSASDIIAQLQTLAPLVPVAACHPGETARRWRYADGSGEIGVIASVTQAFCRDCTRARLSTDGKLYACLFAAHGQDLRTLLRSGASDAELANAVGAAWRQRADRYSELRGNAPPDARKIEMSYIGG